MKRLVKSRQTGIFCTQCDKSIPVNTSRIIDSGMHSHYECLNKLKLKVNIMSENNNPWVFCETTPKEDGKYNAREDEWDEDIFTNVEVKHGRAERFFINYEWQKTE